MERLEKVRKKLKLSSVEYVDTKGLGGGLVPWLHDGFDISVLDKHKNCIDTQVLTQGEDRLVRISWVYADCSFNRR